MVLFHCIRNKPCTNIIPHNLWVAHIHQLPLADHHGYQHLILIFYLKFQDQHFMIILLPKCCRKREGHSVHIFYVLILGKIFKLLKRATCIPLAYSYSLDPFVCIPSYQLLLLSDLLLLYSRTLCNPEISHAKCAQVLL